VSSNDTTEEPAARAERLFANLTDQAERLRSGERISAVPVSDPVPVPTDHPYRAEAVPPPEGQVRDLVRAALDATDRIAEVVQVLASQADTTTAGLAQLSQAMGQALKATNERLAAVERILFNQLAPSPGPASVEAGEC